MDRQYKDILATASKELENLKGQTFCGELHIYPLKTLLK